MELNPYESNSTIGTNDLHEIKTDTDNLYIGTDDLQDVAKPDNEVIPPKLY